MFYLPFVFDDAATLDQHGIPKGPHGSPTLDWYIFTAFCQHLLKTLLGEYV